MNSGLAAMSSILNYFYSIDTDQEKLQKILIKIAGGNEKIDLLKKKIDEHRSVYSQSKDRTRYKVTKDYQFTVKLKNNEPSEVVAIYDFSGSKTHSKPIKVTIPAESEVEATHDVQYQTFRYQ